MSAFDDLPLDLDLSAQSVQAYLGATGWTLTRADDVAQTWELYEGQRPEARLRLPVDRTLDDYGRWFREALQRLCRVYDWNAQQLATQVIGARSDFLYIRADQPSADGSIPLNQAEAMLRGADALMPSAASSAVRAQSEHRGRRPNMVRDFVREDVRMGHTQRGSFIITILTHLGDDEIVEVEAQDRAVLESSDVAIAVAADNDLAQTIETARADVQLRIPPFQRRVMSTLATGLESARAMALHTGAHTMDDAVNRGLSANMVDALAVMTSGFDGLRSLDVSFGWAVAERTPPPSVEEVKVDRTVIPALSDLRGRLERRPREPDTATVYGQVTRLERGGDEESGTVTISGAVGETRRSVKLELTGKLYNGAIRAHRSRATVTATGILTRRGNTNWLEGEIAFAELK